MADRYFSTAPPSSAGIVLEGDESKHLARVARKVVGDEVEVFDGLGHCVRARVDWIGKDRVELSVVEQIFRPTPAISMTLLVATPKGERFDWLVEKATELGVARLVPILAERSSVDPRSAKLDRLRRVIVEASKQCGRDFLMELSDPVAWSKAVSDRSMPVRLLADSGGVSHSAWPKVESRVALAIGPEGGWSPAERSTAEDHGWIRVGLGLTRLRVETAAIAASALILSHGQEGNAR